MGRKGCQGKLVPIRHTSLPPNCAPRLQINSVESVAGNIWQARLFSTNFRYRKHAYTLMCSSEQIQILDPDVIGGEHDFDHLLQCRFYPSWVAEELVAWPRCEASLSLFFFLICSKGKLNFCTLHLRQLCAPLNFFRVNSSSDCSPWK